MAKMKNEKLAGKDTGKGNNKNEKQSMKIMPGTGSGHHPNSGKTNTKMSHPVDMHGLDGRKTASALK